MLKKVLKRSLTLLFLILLLAAAYDPQPFSRSCAAESMGVPAAAAYIDNGGFVVEKDGKIIAAHNPHKMFVPASIIKVATSLAALQILGPAYRFETHFFVDPDHNLYIKGYGDPFLISEEVAIIVRKLKELGCERINNIYVDDTAFALAASADGLGLSDNPYDARNSALAVNFNTVNLEKGPAETIRSAEEQTPTLALMSELSKGLSQGVHRINITRATGAGDQIIRRYTGELFRAFQMHENIAGSGSIAFREVPANLNPFYKHRSSRAIEDVIAPLMLYSNNFIANQIFLAVGAAEFGYPATWEKSKQAVAGLLQEKFNLSAEDIRIVEGSGLSKKNRVSPLAMLKLLDFFKPYSRLLPEKEGIFIKSGTLKGVYSYAGYFTEKEETDSFVLLLNQERNNRDMVLLLLEVLYRKR